MAALDHSINRPIRSAQVTKNFTVDPGTLVVPASVVYGGALVGIRTASGYLIPWDCAETTLFQGMSLSQETSGDGNASVEVDVSGAIMENVAVTGATTVATVGDLVYATDDGTGLTLTEPLLGDAIGFLIFWRSAAVGDVKLFTPSEFRILSEILGSVILPHKTQHQHGGADEVATATPAANAIPKASATGKLDSWISAASTSVPGIMRLATGGETTAGEACDSTDSRLSDMRTADELHDGAADYPITTLVDGQALVVSGGNITSKSMAAMGQRYDETFVVGGTTGTPAAGCTHGTLAEAIAAITADTKIRLQPGEHSLGSGVALDVTGLNVCIEGYGATLSLVASGVGDGLTVSGAGTFVGLGFAVDGNATESADGAGIVADSAFVSFILRDVSAYDCKEGGIKLGTGTTFSLAGVRSYRNYIYGFYADTIEGKFSDCFAGENDGGGAGDGFHFHGAKVVTMTGCSSADQSLGIYEDTADGLTVIGFSANTENRAIEFAASSHSTVDGAYLESCSQGVGGAGGGYYCGGHFANVVADACQTGFSVENATLTNCATINQAAVATSVGIDANLACQIDNCDVGATHAGGIGVILRGAGPKISNSRIVKTNAAEALRCVAATYYTIRGCTITGSGGATYGIVEEGASDYGVISDNIVSGFATDNVRLIGVNSQVNDPVSVRGTQAWAAASGSTTLTLGPLGTGSCPTHFRIIAVDTDNNDNFSRGDDDGTQADCFRHDDAGTVACDTANSINVQNSTASGYTGLITALGQAAGSPQDYFTIDLTVVGGGRNINLNYQAWR